MRKHNNLTTGILKTAAPAWFYEMNRTMQPLKSTRSFSKNGLKDLLKRRGIK